MDVVRGSTPSRGGTVAYQIVGDGPQDVLLLDLWFTHLDLDWDDPFRAKVLRRLGASARVIRFDKSGMGLSDRIAPPAGEALDAWSDEAVAVLDAAGAADVGLYVSDWSGPLGLRLAARHPDRFGRLVVSTSMAGLRRTPANPDGLDPAFIDAARDLVHQRWGTGVISDVLGQDRAQLPPHQLDLDGRYERSSVSRGELPAVVAALTDEDSCSSLTRITAETLVLYRSNPVIPRAQSVLMEAHIPRARLQDVDGHQGWTYPMAEAELPAEMPLALDFLTGSAAQRSLDRRLMTLVFLDVVGSTPMVARMGDSEWSARLGQLTRAIDELLAHHQGVMINTAGDGFFATFPGPSAAVAFALALRPRAATLDVPVRTGVHAGECVVDGDDLRGIAVHAAARVMGLAGPSEIYVSDTVARMLPDELVQSLDDRGTHELRGVPGTTTVFALPPGRS